MSLTRRTLIQSAVLGTAALASVAQAKPKTAIPPQKVSPNRRVLIQSSSRYQIGRAHV